MKVCEHSMVTLIRFIYSPPGSVPSNKIQLRPPSYYQNCVLKRRHRMKVKTWWRNQNWGDLRGEAAHGLQICYFVFLRFFSKPTYPIQCYNWEPVKNNFKRACLSAAEKLKDTSCSLSVFNHALIASLVLFWECSRITSITQGNVLGELSKQDLQTNGLSSTQDVKEAGLWLHPTPEESEILGWSSAIHVFSKPPNSKFKSHYFKIVVFYHSPCATYSGLTTLTD